MTAEDALGDNELVHRILCQQQTEVQAPHMPPTDSVCSNPEIGSSADFAVQIGHPDLGAAACTGSIISKQDLTAQNLVK